MDRNSNTFSYNRGKKIFISDLSVNVFYVYNYQICRNGQSCPCEPCFQFVKWAACSSWKSPKIVKIHLDPEARQNIDTLIHTMRTISPFPWNKLAHPRSRPYWRFSNKKPKLQVPNKTSTYVSDSDM